MTGGLETNLGNVLNPNTTPCRHCGGEFSHDGQRPAKGKQCNFCKKKSQSFSESFRKRFEFVKEIKPEGACVASNGSSNELTLINAILSNQGKL